MCSYPNDLPTGRR